MNVSFDEKRCGYFFFGDGFDFFAYFTADFDEDSKEFLECDHVERDGDSFILHLQIPSVGNHNEELAKEMVLKELKKYWEF